MEKVIDYILRFLLRENTALISRVGYTSDEERFHLYDIVIVPSRFFDESIYGTKQSEPTLPLSQISGTPLLFGDNRIEKRGQTTIVHADIIASTYYLISRYEEYIHSNENRDKHGRFMGKSSIAFRAGFLHRPIVEEYSDLVLHWLSDAGHTITYSAPNFSRIYLTHDVDTLTQYRHLRGFLGGLKRNITSRSGLTTLFQSLLGVEKDPAFTFPWMVKQDATVKGASVIYFIKAALHPHRCDLPCYSLKSKDAKHLFSMIKDSNAQLGIHTSYTSGENSAEIHSEKEKLETCLQEGVTCNRWHFLRTLQPSDFESLIQCGITDDFSMGYADVTGFRLGTCRPVRWINPRTKEVTDLTLHPLVAMDCTLSNEYYMNLSGEEAFDHVRQLLNEIKRHNGEAVLLWHNTIFSSIEKNYHRKLYPQILNELKA